MEPSEYQEAHHKNARDPDVDSSGSIGFGGSHELQFPSLGFCGRRNLSAARFSSKVAGTLMVLLLAYGALTLLGVVR